MSNLRVSSYFAALHTKKLLSFGALSFTMLVNYALLKALKDGFVVKTMGAEAIGFLKFYLLIPATILFLLAYTKLSSFFSQKDIFHWTCWIFFALFCFLFFTIFLVETSFFSQEDKLYYEALFPRFKWLARVILNWEYSLFFILAELWGAIIYTLFFFQLANSVFSVEEAKMNYPLIILCGNMSMPFSSYVIGLLRGDPRNLVLFVLLINLCTLIIYKIVSISFPARNIPGGEIRPQESLAKSLKFVFSSRRLWLLFLMVASLGISLNVVEVFWKGRLGKISGSVEEYITSMGRVQAIQGWSSIVFLLGGMFVLKRFSWRFSALLVPFILFLAGGAFFALILSGGDMKTILFFGVAHTIVGRCLKYVFFDPPKEMVYISLGEKYRTKGKAAVDLLGGRFGKSGLGVIESVVFFFLPAGTFDSTTLFFGAVFLCVTWIWVRAVVLLDQKLKMG